MSDAVQSNPSEVKESSSTPATGEIKAETQESATTEQTPASTEAEAKTADKGETDKSKKDKPKRVPRPKKEGEAETADNEIRVAAKGQIKNYLGYAFRILNKTDHRSMTIRATGNAIVKALILIELVKRRVGDLHQRNKIYSMEIESFEESKIEGMEKIATKRRVTAMDTELSKDPLDENDPGYQKPEPKEEGQQISNPPKTQEKKGKSKKHRGPKLYNALPGEEGKDKKDAQDGDKKKRRDGDTNQNKHGQENEKKKNKKNKNKGGQEGENKQGGPEGGQGGKNKKGKSRKENLRNLINDDEMPRGQRGMRGMRGGRGGPGRGGRGGFNMGPMMERDFPGGPRFDPMYRDSREYGGPGGFIPRSNDDFFVSSQRQQRGGRGGRRGGPPEMYPPMRYPNYPMRGYVDHYNDHDYYNGPMYHGPRGGYNAPVGQYRRDPRDMPPRGYRPDFDQRQGQPPMGGRGMPMRGGRRDDHPDDDPRGNRGRGGGRGRGNREDGAPPMRGGMRPPQRGRGGHHQEKDDNQAPILHRRARGGGGEASRGDRGGHGGRD